MTDTTHLSQLKRALFAIKKLKQELRDQVNTPQPVAVVGLSCRFPQASNKKEFWELLKQGKNAISHLPKQRLDLLKGTKEYDSYQPNYPYWGGYIEKIEQFDPLFFGITPREAILMDPQQRLLLEVTHEALEDAGLPIELIAGSNTGVFIGMYGSEFAGLQRIESDMDALYLPTGNASSIAANRLSYQFDLHGPSMTLDTACSTSLVAINLACAALQNKQCNIAIVGGAKINLLPSSNVILSQAKMLSADGQCKTFDAGANGYVQGEGVGVVILKPLADALRDNDRIYSVIVGSAVNQDGKSNGLTAPNGAQQEALLRTAYSVSQIDPAQVSYIECHGTGTVLGDPIEVEALENAIGKTHSNEQPCVLGSVKTNIGHLEPAAGIAGLIKVSLALQKGKIPPHRNFVSPNPHIAFSQYHFQIPLQYQDWPLYGDYRVAGVSSFGFGGTNAHVVLREIYGTEKSIPSDSHPNTPELFTLSAKDSTALQLLIKKWCHFLETNGALDLSQICYNLHIKRTHYFYRLAIIANTVTELHAALLKLEEYPNHTSTGIYTHANQQQATDTDLSRLASNYINHVAIDWVKYELPRRFSFMDMPLYPWQHKVYWPEFTPISTPSQKQPPVVTHDDHPLQGKQVNSSIDGTIQFEFTLDTSLLPELADTYYVAHIGFYLEMLGFCAQHLSGQIPFEIRDLLLGNMIYVPKGRTMSIRLAFNKITQHTYSFKIYSQDDKTNQHVEHAHGQLIWPPVNKVKPQRPDQFKENLASLGSGDDFFKRIKSMDMPIGGSIRWTEQFWKNSNTILSEFRKPDLNSKADLYALKLHPGVFDACVQPLFMLLDEGIKQPYLTTQIKSFKYFGASDHALFVFVKRRSQAKMGRLISGNWDLMDSEGHMIASCDSIQLTQLGRGNASGEEADLFSPMLDKLNVSEIPELKRKETIVDFLRGQVAYIFKMPNAEVPVDQPLTNMGMDSLMTMVLSKKIEESMGISFSLQELLKPLSINELAEQVLIVANPVGTNTMSVKNEYLPYCQRRVKPKMRLFCFPFGGGGASIYRSWYQDFPDDIEVCPVQLPGRENLETTPPISDIKVLVSTLHANISSDLDLPFAFYGHSFGSLIAFELTRYLKKNELKEPSHLFMAAYPSPHKSGRPSSFQSLLRHLNNLPYNVWEMSPNDLSEKQINDIMKLFKNTMPDMDYSAYDAQLLRTLIPYFLADILIVATHELSLDDPLSVPITAFYGSHDQFVSEKSVKEWGSYTQSAFNTQSINGEHLFIKTQEGKRETIEAIINTLIIPGG